jgi:hypothetical protein
MSEDKMNSPGRHYRVIKRLPWIEGGRPTPSGWEGGEAVVYKPGDTVYVDDREAGGMDDCLEALDDAGRAILEEARAKAEAPAEITFLADLDQDTVDSLAGALDKKRQAYGGCQIERRWATNRDGSKTLLSTRYIPIDPLPGVVYGDNGLPDLYATSLRRERLEKERKLARIRSGGSLGGRRGRETKRDKTARSNEALLADVRAYRTQHPSHGVPAIAAALVDKHGNIRDHTDPRGREKAIEALRKRIARLEKSLDR